MRAATLNHGGMVTRLREAVAANRKLRSDAGRTEAVETATLTWQGDGRLYRTMRTLASDNDIVLIQETHLPEGDGEVRARMRNMLTTGEYGQWKLHESPAPADDTSAGVLTWYNAETVEIT